MQHDKNLENKLQNWKNKAITRGKKLRELKAKLKRMEKSNGSMKKKIRELKSSPRSSPDFSTKNFDSSPKPSRHHYSSFLIGMCLSLRSRSNCSLRGCIESLKLFFESAGVDWTLPSYTTLRNWELKKGYFHLYHEEHAPGKWIYIVDESMNIGQESIMLVQGVRHENWQADKPLSFQDVEPLLVGVKSSWKWNDLHCELKKLEASGHECAYVVSDGGPNLVKCFDELSWTRIEDCGHSLGNLLEKQYKKDPEFEAFSKACSGFKKKITMSEYAAYMPPTQRRKGRFMNLMPLAEWAHKTLELIDAPQFDRSPKLWGWLNWIESYRAFISELYQASKAVEVLCTILKNNGLSLQSAQEYSTWVEQVKPPEWIVEGSKAYLERNLAILPEEEICLCSSDIIESTFGKFKAKMTKSPARGITESCLSIANYGRENTNETVKMAMEKVKLSDIDAWREEHIKENLARKCRNLYQKVA